MHLMWIEGYGWCKSTRTFSRTPVGQVVKTSPFHGENTSSTLVWVIDRRPFADVFTQSSMDTSVSLTENGHFIIVL